MNLFRKKEEDPQTVEVKGNEIKCPICNNSYFWTRQAQLNTAVATFFKLVWANKSTTCFVCLECTHISWFLGEQ